MIQVLRAWLQAIKDALRRLVELMEEWQLILTEKSRGTFHEPVSSAAAKSVLRCCHPVLCLQSFLGQIWFQCGSDKTNACQIVTALLPLPACKPMFVRLVLTHGKVVPCLWLKVLCC